MNGFVSFLYEIKGNINEDMDFLNDIDKESLTDAPDTRIFTSMSFKVKNKKVKIETTQNIIGLIHGIRPFYLSCLIFCLSSFYEFTAKVGNKMPQILEPKYRKS